MGALFGNDNFISAYMTDLAPVVTRPPLRYFGGKFRLAPWILSHVPDHRGWVEPFGGGASVLLRKPRAHSELYNDLESEVVNFFEVMRNEPERLIADLELTPFAREEFEASYSQMNSADPYTRARAFIVRNQMGFGSSTAARTRKTGFRHNSINNNHASATDWRNLPHALTAVAGRLRGVVIENRDYREIVPKWDYEQTVIYCDPPYTLSERTSGEKYVHEFSDADYEEMGRILHDLKKAGAMVSGYDCELYREMFKDWRCYTKDARCDHGAERVECLWISPLVPSPQMEMEWR